MNTIISFLVMDNSAMKSVKVVSRGGLESVCVSECFILFLLNRFVTSNATVTGHRQ